MLEQRKNKKLRNIEKLFDHYRKLRQIHSKNVHLIELYINLFSSIIKWHLIKLIDDIRLYCCKIIKR